MGRALELGFSLGHRLPPLPHSGPVLSCASHTRLEEESKELSGVGLAAESNLGPNRLALTRAPGAGVVWSGPASAGHKPQPLPVASAGRRRGVT